jgi:hypothetical protein
VWIILAFLSFALDWLRSQEDVPVETEPAIDFTKLGSVPICVRSPEDRQGELQEVMNWSRNKGKGKKSKYDPHGNFRKLDKLLPKKRGQTSDDRAKIDAQK